VCWLPAVVEDPAIANAALPEASFNTSSNVDRETAALLLTLPPDEQAAYMAAAAAAEQASGVDAAGQSGGSGSAASNNTSPGVGGDGGAAAAAAATAELLAVFETLRSSIADGSMERSTGYTVLDLSATVT
jgi:hypothetical protein